MKKFLMLFVVLVCLAFTANAQNAIGKSRFTDNWYVGASGSVLTTMKFDPFLPVEGDVSVRLGKWITPGIGFNIEERVGWGTPSLWAYYLTKNVVRTNNLSLNVDVDLLQAISFKPDRMFTVIPEVGIGWLHGYGDGGIDDMSAKTGVMLGFNLGKYKAWQFYLEPEIIWNLTNSGNKPNFYKENGQIGLEVGFCYRFKNKNGTHNFQNLYGLTEQELANLNASINSLMDENAFLAAALEDCRNNPVTITDTVFVYVDRDPVNNVVGFELNSAKVQKTQMVSIWQVANAMKADPTLNITIKAYADAQTGSAPYNQMLSDKRAEAVKEVLVNKFDIDPARIDTEGLGSTEQIFEENDWNRIAVFVKQ